MIRSEIIDSFRVQNPEVTSRVITDTQLYSWCEEGDKLFCAETRCITDQDGTEWDSAVDDIYYDLGSRITKFYTIDDYPGSGVLFDGKRLDKVTMAELDMESSNWRDRSSGTPKKWYRRGQYLYLDRKIATAALKVKVYAVLISNDWDSDVAPFNELTHLEPFHNAMTLYLTMRCKAKIAKPEEVVAARTEYMEYVKWAKSQLGENRYSPVYYRRKI